MSNLVFYFTPINVVVFLELFLSLRLGATEDAFFNLSTFYVQKNATDKNVINCVYLTT
jgi:hypothetical protein